MRYDQLPAISEIIRMATDLSRNEKTFFIYTVKETLPNKLLLDKEPLVGGMDVNSIDISSGYMRIRFRKEALIGLNNALRKKALSAHPPQVVIAYKGTFYFSPYVMLPLSEETGSKLPGWLPQEIFTWSR